MKEKKPYQGNRMKRKRKRQTAGGEAEGKCRCRNGEDVADKVDVVEKL